MREIEQSGFLDDFGGSLLQGGGSLMNAELEFLMSAAQVVLRFLPSGDATTRSFSQDDNHGGKDQETEQSGDIGNILNRERVGGRQEHIPDSDRGDGDRQDRGPQAAIPGGKYQGEPGRVVGVVHAKEGIEEVSQQKG